VLFHSFQFLIFYLAALVVFFALPSRHRWAFLLFASYVFYASWRLEYLVLIAGSTLINYAVGLGLESATKPRTRKALLAVGVTASLSILFFFKYLDFALGSTATLLGWLGLEWQAPRYAFLLPLGISFFTFQAVGYTIDVYRGTIRAERHLGIFALFVSFFPQLIAGPIERSHQLLPQLRRRTRLEAERVRSGLRMILWGLFKKVVIADSVAVAVDRVYALPGEFSGADLTLATVFFAVQIYCDFSGYSEMAIGTARMLGYDLMTNFRRPYLARSLAGFWRRWHISLSTWFRDYLYLPLGGNRVAHARWMFNILVVFVVSGLWHGANWTFVVWGGIHGVCLVVAALTASARGRLADAVGLRRVPALHALLQIPVVCAIAVLAWVFFRADDLGAAGTVLSGIFTGDWALSASWRMGLPFFEFRATLWSIALLFAVEMIQEWQPRPVARLWSLRPVRWTSYAVLFYAIALLGAFGGMEFIYFQF
jgi:alginate O-acetyltransferase complex protein AlgI